MFELAVSLLVAGVSRPSRPGEEISRDEGTTMIVSADGSYRSLTTGGAITEGKFYLQDGQLRYRSSRTTGAATLSEDPDKTVLTVMPADPKYHTGRAEYERVK